MLQISSGKFFTSQNPDDHHTTIHRAVLYTNYRIFGTNHRIDTAVGSLLPSNFVDDLSVLTCEVTERLEKLGKQPQVGELISTGGNTLINDFAALVSFGLNITCTPDQNLTRRLIATKRMALGACDLPSSYIPRIFDSEIVSNANEIKQLNDFITDLIGKDRKTYQGVMRAIRRYVIGMYRISDDIDLAYASLVASIESLAQEFDQFSPEWSDYDQRKRKLMDEALAEASSEIRGKVREAILKSEHVALGRRFRIFALEHLTPSFFREEAALTNSPIGRSDLDLALKNAYQIRSKYVHELHPLPKLLTNSFYHADVTQVDGQPTLTFQGLARVARHVIFQVVSRAPNVSLETFNYHNALPNIITMPVAPQYWIWNADGYNKDNANQYLEGFLSQYVDYLQTDAAFTDIRPVLFKIESLVPNLNKVSQRLPMVSLYLMFSWFLPEEERTKNSYFIDNYLDDFAHPSIESLLIHILMNQIPTWSLSELDELFDKYMRQRYHKQGLNLGNLFEAAITLWIAEKYRSEGNEIRAKELIALAVENFPSNTQLRDFECSLVDDCLATMDWKKILLCRNLI